jgi:hypothetical protein
MHSNGLVPTFWYPELHTQDVIDVLDAGDVLKLGHAVHCQLPFPAAKVFIGQGVHRAGRIPFQSNQ